MLLFRLLIAFDAVLAVALTSTGDPPAPERTLPTGEWTIEFANGVVETCEIGKDGAARETEPNRKSDGKATDKDGVNVIVFDDDRTERWTESRRGVR